MSLLESPSPTAPNGYRFRTEPPAATPASITEWVESVAAMAKPSAIVWADGSQEEFDALAALMVAKGTMLRLNDEKRPNSYLVRSNPADVARVESRTFICSVRQEDAGPTNNWVDPIEMRGTLDGLFDGVMEGRTMYVIPFSMGPIGSPLSRYGIQVTDSPYVVASMRIMTRMGDQALSRITDTTPWVKAAHTVGYPLRPGVEDIAWPSNEKKYITHFPETREI